MNNFGILFSKDIEIPKKHWWSKKKYIEKFFLYQSYATVESMVKVLQEDPEVAELPNVFMADITDCPLNIIKNKGEKDGNEEN